MHGLLRRFMRVLPVAIANFIAIVAANLTDFTVAKFRAHVDVVADQLLRPVGRAEFHTL